MRRFHKREERPEAGSPDQTLFTIAADVLEKQVAKRDVREAVGDGGAQAAAIRLPRTSRSGTDGMLTTTSGRRPATSAWRRSSSSRDAVHRHPIDRRASLIGVSSASWPPNAVFDRRSVEHPRAVFAAAPGDEHLHLGTPPGEARAR